MIQLARPQVNLAVLGLGILLLSLGWMSTAGHLFDLVWHNEAYSHGLWVPVVALWLVWRRRDAVLAAGPRFWWPGALIVAGVQVLWLLGALVEARVVEHAALVLALQAVVLTCLGPSAVRPIAFPLGFLFLIIPVGEQLVGPLQVITAKLVIWALDVTGIPFKADGVLIELSSGLYQVARACAGVKFLFSSLVMGVLLCHLAFVSWRRRAVMMVAAVLVPILANAVRVYTTLLIAEWTDQSFAKDVDHIVYGWGFLSVVLLLLIAGAYRFSDTDQADDANAHDEAGDVPSFPAGQSPIAVLAVASAFFLPVASAWWANQTTLETRQCFASEMRLPDCEDCGYRLLPGTAGGRWFRPDLSNENLVWHYRRNATSIMGLTSLYEGKATAHRMGRSFRYMLPPRWNELEGGASPGEVPVAAGFAEKVIWQGERRRLIWQTFVVGDDLFRGATEAKFAVAMQRLMGRASSAQRILVSTSYLEDADTARRHLENFLSTFGTDAFLWSADETGTDNSLCAG